METVKMYCTRGMLTGKPDSRVTVFDAWENYDILNEFYGSFDKSWMRPRETYFDGLDRDTWEDYVIFEEGKIVARAAIWMYSDEAWEVAGVLTRPTHRRRGCGEAVVRFCAASIVERGRKATCTTGGDNIAMINTMKAVGFQPMTNI